MSERTPIKKRGRTRKTTSSEVVLACEEVANAATDDGVPVGQVDDEQVRRLHFLRTSPDTQFF